MTIVTSNTAVATKPKNGKKAASAGEHSIRYIPVSEIRRGENPRRTFDPVALQELANSVRLQGVIQPISVRPVQPDDDGTTFAIIAGERRFRACGLADMTEIPCIVRDVDEVAAVELAIAENMERESLNPIDEAWGFNLLMQRNRTQQQIAERLHKSQPFVANRIRLLGLPDEVQGLVGDGTLSPSAGIALCALSDFPEQLIKLADEALEKSWSVKMIEERAADFKRAEAQRVQPSMDVEPEKEAEPEAASPQEVAAAPAVVNQASQEAVTEGQDSGPADTPPAAVEAVSPAPEQDDEVFRSEADAETAQEAKPGVETAQEAEAAKPPRTDMDSAIAGYEAAKTAPPVAPAQPAAPPTANPANMLPTGAKPPAAPPEPEPDPLAGYTDVPLPIADYMACAERGLWPLSVVLSTVTELEAGALDPQALAAAERLAEINRNSLSVLEEPEIAVLQELFPERETTTAGHIAGAMLVYRLRKIADVMNEESGRELSIIGQIDTGAAVEIVGQLAEEAGELEGALA